jgi:hypothetical protein
MEVLLPKAGPGVGGAENPFGTPACRPCALDLLGLEDETGWEEMSTGPGRLMRRVTEVIEGAENRSMTRRRLETVLVAEGFDRSNILRAVRSLAERRAVYLREGHTLDESYVSVPQPVRMFSDEQIAEILESL